jgi:hypothetical protein
MDNGKPAPQLMGSLSKRDRERALKAALFLCMRQLQDIDPEEQGAQELGFGSVEAMRAQLADWGAPDWMLTETHEYNTKAATARGGGKRRNVRPAADAASVFERTAQKLSVFVERLPLRREHRRGKRFVLTKAKPLLEGSEPGENVGYLEAPPDIPPNEDGVIRFTLAQAYRRVPGGAARYPDQELTAATTAALLTGTATTDQLIDLLQDNPTQEVRRQARKLWEGNTYQTRRDSLQNKARQMAALIWGNPVDKGNSTHAVSKELQAGHRLRGQPLHALVVVHE